MSSPNTRREGGACPQSASGILEVDFTQTRDLRAQVLDEHGRLTIQPAAYWAQTTIAERALFGHRTGIYSFPTTELLERLRELIAGRSAIEIGSGNGVLAEALDIPATDNFQQRMPQYEMLYALQGQITVPYGPNVIEMHASRAVRHYRPDVVIACWVTHKWDPKEPERGGNEIGIDEPDILRHCKAYILVGNEGTHVQKPIWDRKYVIEYPPYVFSRAANGGRDFIAVFEGLKR